MILPANNNSWPGWRLIRQQVFCILYFTTEEIIQTWQQMCIWLFPGMAVQPSWTEKYLKQFFYEVTERRLDAVIYRSKFSYTIKSAKQLIKQGNVKVNGNIITNPSFSLRKGDLIQLTNRLHITKEIVKRSFKRVWPHPPSHLNINYKTLQIIVGELNYNNLSTCFHFQLKPENMILDFFYH